MKGARVTIIVSSGPAQLSLPTLTGMSEADAKSAIKTAHFLVGKKIIHQFDPKVDKGTVVDYLDAAGKSLLTASVYSEGRPITLVISAGPLPAVAGLSVSAAQAVLAQAGLKNSQASPTSAYNATIQQGDVIEIDQQPNAAGVGRVFRVGDTAPVLLIISKGPQMVKVPNVVGMTWANAKAELLAAGFKLNYYEHFDSVAVFVHVQSTNPTGGSLAALHSTVTVAIS